MRRRSSGDSAALVFAIAALITARARAALSPCPVSMTTPITTAQTTAAYDPSKVDWKSFVATVDTIGRLDPRVCSYIVRTFFHDAGSFAPGRNGTGADASLLLQRLEVIRASSNPHGPSTRYILERLVARFGTSWADALSVATAVCTQSLGSSVNVAKTCSAARLPLWVGKLDRDRSVGRAAEIKLVDQLPGAEADLPEWLRYWRRSVNGGIEQSEWQMTATDAIALMGSHTMLKRFDCQLDKNADGTCGGLRSASWRNDYFQDLLSGSIAVFNSTGKPCFGGVSKCVPVAAPAGVGCGCGNCSFSTFLDKAAPLFFQADGLRSKQIVNGHIMDETPPTSISVDNPSMWVRWKPNPATRAPCCNCAPCGSDGSQDTAFCQFDGTAKGEVQWTYTVNDAILAQASRSQFFPPLPGPYPDYIVDVFELKVAVRRFARSANAWETAFAKAHCKLSAHRALFGDHQSDVWKLIRAQGGGDAKPDADVVSACMDPCPTAAG